MSLFERKFIYEHGYFYMLPFSFSKAYSQPGYPDKEKFSQFFRPIKGIVENVTHNDLRENDKDHSGEHRNDQDFFDFVKHIDNA